MNDENEIRAFVWCKGGEEYLRFVIEDPDCMEILDDNNEESIFIAYRDLNTLVRYIRRVQSERRNKTRRARTKREQA